MTFDKIMVEITSGLTGNHEVDIKYLLSQAEKYKNSEFSLEITRAIGRIIFDIVPEELRKNTGKIIENNNLGMEKTLEEVRFLIYKREFNKAFKITEGLINNIEELGWYKDDNVSEYHSFDNLFEELIYMEIFNPVKKVRQIPESYSNAYLTYGVLLVELKEYDKAKLALEKALKYNPVCTSILFEIAEIHKLNKNWTEYLNLNKKCLEFAYTGQALARCYRNYGYYFIEQEKYTLANYVYFLSINYDQESTMAQSQLMYISEKTGESVQKPKENELIELLKNNDIQIGANPLILAMAQHIAKETFNNKNLEVSKYFFNILYDLTKDDSFKDIAGKLSSAKLNQKVKAKSKTKIETKQKRLPKLTEEELLEYRNLLKNKMSKEWCDAHLDIEINVMRRRTAKEQHLKLNYFRENPHPVD